MLRAKPVAFDNAVTPPAPSRCASLAANSRRPRSSRNGADCSQRIRMAARSITAGEWTARSASLQADFRILFGRSQQHPRFVNFAADPYLRDRWTAGERNVRCLLREVREQGFTGCYSRLAAFVAPWRQKVAMRPTPPAPVGTLPLDPSDGRTDLANRRSGAVHQATRLAHSASGREGRCPQADIADVCLHAGTGDAFPRPAARQ